MLLINTTNSENSDVNRKNEGACRGIAAIYAPLGLETFEAHFRDCFVKGLIQDPARLFHTIDTLHQAHDPLLVSPGQRNLAVVP